MAISNCEINVKISNGEGLDALARAAELSAALSGMEAPGVKLLVEELVGALQVVAKSLKPRTREVPVEVTRVACKTLDIEVGNLELKPGDGINEFGHLKIDGIEIKEIRSIDVHWAVGELGIVRVEQVICKRTDGTIQDEESTWRDK